MIGFFNDIVGNMQYDNFMVSADKLKFFFATVDPEFRFLAVRRS